MASPRISALVLWAFMAPLVAFAQEDLSLDSHVVDKAGLLSATEANDLEKFLSEHEAATSNQIIVVTLSSLEGKNIEEFALELGRRWGIGTKEKNNGVLLVVAPHERAVRIEVAYGLEDILTDARAKMIIERNILPSFRRGEMASGIIQGVHTIVETLGGEHKALESDEPNVLNWSSILFIFLLIIIFLIRSNSGRRPPRSGPFFGSGRGGSGSSGSGGLSGGGGSFGGGGASGKWLKIT